MLCNAWDRLRYNLNSFWLSWVDDHCVLSSFVNLNCDVYADSGGGIDLYDNLIRNTVGFFNDTNNFWFFREIESTLLDSSINTGYNFRFLIVYWKDCDGWFDNWKDTTNWLGWSLNDINYVNLSLRIYWYLDLYANSSGLRDNHNLRTCRKLSGLNKLNLLGVDCWNLDFDVVDYLLNIRLVLFDDWNIVRYFYSDSSLDIHFNDGSDWLNRRWNKGIFNNSDGGLFLVFNCHYSLQFSLNLENKGYFNAAFHLFDDRCCWLNTNKLSVCLMDEF